MKKALSLVLALAMIMSLSITAFANETGVEAGSYNTEVIGTYVEGSDSNGTVFSVDIKWTGMSFTYYAEKGPVWNTNDHTYSEAEPARWEGTGTITVTNHSNTKISATPVYAKEAGYESVEITFGTDKLILVSADIDNTAVSDTITVTPGGSLPAISNETNSAKIGTITVTIAQSEDATQKEVEALVSIINGNRTKWEQNGASDDELSSASYFVSAYNTEKATLEMNSQEMTQERLNYYYNSMNNKINEMEANYGG